MPVPTYGAVPIFGARVRIEPDPEPRAEQQTSTFGLSGLGLSDGGSRGILFRCSGMHAGPGPAGLATAQALFRGFNTGGGFTLIDQLGQAWYPTLMKHFQPKGRIRQTPAGWYEQDYEATFLYIGA